MKEETVAFDGSPTENDVFKIVGSERHSHGLLFGGELQVDVVGVVALDMPYFFKKLSSNSYAGKNKRTPRRHWTATLAMKFDSALVM